jgi:hypothetical protein
MAKQLRENDEHSEWYMLIIRGIRSHDGSVNATGRGVLPAISRDTAAKSWRNMPPEEKKRLIQELEEERAKPRRKSLATTRAVSKAFKMGIGNIESAVSFTLCFGVSV